VDDLPLLLIQLKEVCVPELPNESFPTPGNWQGLSLGRLMTGLPFILMTITGEIDGQPIAFTGVA
jgi:hypothetical protein